MKYRRSAQFDRNPAPQICWKIFIDGELIPRRLALGRAVHAAGRPRDRADIPGVDCDSTPSTRQQQQSSP